MKGGDAWIGDDDEHLHRVRAKNDHLAQLPRRMRRAEVVCADVHGRPRQLAVVFPRFAPHFEVHFQHGGVSLGVDFAVDCLCPVGRHRIEGAQLRAAALSITPRTGRVATIDVRRVEYRDG